MYFTFNNTKVPVLPTDIVPLAFGGDGIKTVAEDLGMNSEDILKADKEFHLNVILMQRASEYPSFADQFDTLYHGGYDAWKASIDAIKIKYPKSTE